jgi:hypothetical protein
MVHTLTRAYTGELFYSPSHFPQMTQSEAANFDLEV